MSVLGGDYNHTVGSTHTIDGSRCVLEDTYLFYIVLVKIVELSFVFYHTVNDIKRGSHVANLQRGNGTRAAVGLS